MVLSVISKRASGGLFVGLAELAAGGSFRRWRDLGRLLGIDEPFLSEALH